VLDRVERGRFVEQPAREDPSPLVVAPAHVGLYESAGELLLLPGRGRLAGAQANHHVADPHRLTGAQRYVPRDAVALVEQADHRDPLRHRRLARDLAGG
jgi:hypothetical protein